MPTVSDKIHEIANKLAKKNNHQKQVTAFCMDLIDSFNPLQKDWLDGKTYGMTVRQSGRSYFLAVSAIIECLANPGKPVQIIDHFKTRAANEYLARMVVKIIRDKYPKDLPDNWKTCISERCFYIKYESN